MLQNVELTNFKCFRKQAFPFSNLTVLAGLNGMGKSSLMQSLLLLRQSNRDSDLSRGLKLNGSLVSLGNARDVLYEQAEEDALAIEVREDGGEACYRFECADPSSDNLPLTQQQGGIGEDSVLFSDRFTYLSAYRIAPMPLYRITNESDLKRRDFGINGEFAIQYLNINGGKPISCERMLCGGPDSNSLSLQVQAWMGLVSPGVLPVININPTTRTAELGYEFIQGDTKSMTFKSTNVGFGITYVLPVVVTLLSAQPGDLILIENPEAHIHPKGQRYLGELVACAAASGVQVLLETHSDHVLNGIRIAVRQNRLDPEQVMLTYFAMGGDGSDRRIVWPKLLRNGRLDQWPEGFFDEWDNSLLELL